MHTYTHIKTGVFMVTACCGQFSRVQSGEMGPAPLGDLNFQRAC